ncbi:hypothetical protein V1477_016989 [Vespula maculifrons]|uniref:Uncharacterized protein n=1 Tax=Vespula maculifrons TaxID=7453 RepID=A0ABD2B512_VESMC
MFNVGPSSEVVGSTVNFTTCLPSRALDAIERTRKKRWRRSRSRSRSSSRRRRRRRKRRGRKKKENPPHGGMRKLRTRRKQREGEARMSPPAGPRQAYQANGTTRFADVALLLELRLAGTFSSLSSTWLIRRVPVGHTILSQLKLPVLDTGAICKQDFTHLQLVKKPESSEATCHPGTRILE